MKFILSIIIIFILVILQSSLYPYLAICGAFPSLILILVIILSILKGYKKSLIWVIFGGFFSDVFSFINPIGVSIVILFLISYLTYFLSRNVFKKTNVFSVILLGIGTALIYKFFLILVFLITGASFQLSFIQTIFQIVYNLFLLIPLFYLIKRFIHA